MKLIRILTVCLFSLVILVPLALFNFEEGAVSKIDNRALAGNPLEAQGDLTKNIESYVSDRIGLRNEMILSYTVLNDRLFGKMVHPSYVYGKEGCVFGAGLFVREEYTDYHRQFADMVKAMQDYCDARQIPFLFVFDPAKPAVLTRYIADGYNYDRSWVDAFLAALDERGVRYLDNTQTLLAQDQAGKVVFNPKYDANHWNDLGAYYGVNAILQELQKDFPAVHIIAESELTIGKTLQTSLPVSEFPIHEEVPSITVNAQVSDPTADYGRELMIDPSFPYFEYYVNQELLEKGAPKALVFQGSYMNGFGYKYMAAGLGEYIAIHDYQNVMALDYYVNVLQPDCVVFEVAEYTFNETYFSTEKMGNMDLAPTLEQAKALAAQTREAILSPAELTVEKGQALTTITWHTAEAFDYAWLLMGRECDMRRVDGGFAVTIPTAQYEAFDGEISVCTLSQGCITIRTPQ